MSLWLSCVCGRGWLGFLLTVDCGTKETQDDTIGGAFVINRADFYPV